jgi:hypothetical protein
MIFALVTFSPELAVAGIGIHHAGLSLDDRHAVEGLYLKMQLKVLVATSVRNNMFPFCFGINEYAIRRLLPWE